MPPAVQRRDPGPPSPESDVGPAPTSTSTGTSAREKPNISKRRVRDESDSDSGKDADSDDDRGDGRKKLSPAKIQIGVLDLTRILSGLFLLSSVLSWLVTNDSVLWGYRPSITRPDVVRAWLVRSPLVHYLSTYSPEPEFTMAIYL